MAVADSIVIFDGQLPGDPYSAKRPRCRCTHAGKAMAYSPKEYDEELERVAWLLVAGRLVPAPVAAAVEVVMRCYLPDRRPKDVDNLAKTVLDAASKVLWDDDRQVMRLDVSKVYGVGAASAHTRLLVRTVLVVTVTPQRDASPSLTTGRNTMSDHDALPSDLNPDDPPDPSDREWLLEPRYASGVYIAIEDDVLLHPGSRDEPPEHGPVLYVGDDPEGNVGGSSIPLDDPDLVHALPAARLPPNWSEGTIRARADLPFEARVGMIAAAKLILGVVLDDGEPEAVGDFGSEPF